MGEARNGFANMSAERHRAVSVKGGRAVQRSGKGHKFTSAEAKVAGAKGGRAVWAKLRGAPPDPVTETRLAALTDDDEAPATLPSSGVPCSA